MDNLTVNRKKKDLLALFKSTAEYLTGYKVGYVRRRENRPEDSINANKQRGIPDRVAGKRLEYVTHGIHLRISGFAGSPRGSCVQAERRRKKNDRAG